MADNLLDKASILLTPTAYNDGRMLSVKPNENLYGSELVTNGDFAVDGNWSKGTGTTISNGSANFVNSGGLGLWQNVGTQSGIVKVTFDVTIYTSGTLNVYSGGNQTVSSYINVVANSLGSYTAYVDRNGGNSNIIFGSSDNFTGSIDNVSVVEDLTGDFTFSRSSAATRVNAQGLVENVQIISSELVSNGNFSQIGTEEVSNGNFSQEGSELVTNGDFATDSDWTFTSGWSISDGKLIANNATSIAYQGISAQPNKSYKVTFTVSSYTSGNVKIQFLGGSNSGTPRTSTGTFTEYITLDGSANGNFAFSRTQNFTGSIDNISVKEVGQDWNLGTGWSIGDGVASCDGTQTGWSILQQNNILPPDGSIVKIVANVSNYSSGNLYIKAGFGDTGFQISSDGTFTTYRVVNGSSQFRLQADLNFNGSITNISVKEVGQDWIFGTGWSMGDGYAVTDGTISQSLEQNNVATVGKKYRISFDITRLTSGVIDGRARLNSVGSLSFSDEGSYSADIIADGSNLRVTTLSGNAASWSVDNISVKEITDDTDLPRITHEGFSYQDSLGSELVSNGGFDTDSNWNKNSNWSISGNTANCDGTSNGDINQGTTLATTGKSYRITFDIVSISQGEFFFKFGGVNGTFRNSIGTYTETIQAINSNRISLDSLNNAIGSIDNVSVKEVIGQEVVPDSGCGSWLLEPQSTNLVTYSEDLSDSSWLKASSGTASIPSVTSNYSVSPDGTLNASRVVFDLNEGTTSSDFSQLQHNISSTSGLSHTSSVYMKSNNDNTYNLTFIPVSGSTTIVSVTPQWKRFDLSANLSSSNMRIRTRGSESSSDVTDISIWGAQLEQQSYATSYIPTNGATNTRLQDIADNSGNSTLINSTEGVLYAEIAALADDGTFRYISLINDASNFVQIYYKDSSNRISAIVKSSGSTQFFTNHNLSDATNFIKVAIKYKQNDFALWVDGVEVATDTNGNTPSGLSKLDFDFLGGNNFYGKNKAIAVYKEALTDAELQSLTTI